MDGYHKFKIYQLLESHFTYTMTYEHKNQQHQSLVTAVKCPSFWSFDQSWTSNEVISRNCDSNWLPSHYWQVSCSLQTSSELNCGQKLRVDQ